MIDFEATIKLIQKDRSGTHSCHPACSKCVGYAHRYVEAALGDKPLYTATSYSVDDCVGGIDCTRGDWAGKHQCSRISGYVQVWPKETGDE